MTRSRAKSPAKNTPTERLREFASKVSPPPTSILATAHVPRVIKRPEPTGAIVTGTDPCTCGHAPEEHGREPAYPGSTACRAEIEGDPCCDRVAYEADPEEA